MDRFHIVPVGEGKRLGPQCPSIVLSAAESLTGRAGYTEALCCTDRLSRLLAAFDGQSP